MVPISAEYESSICEVKSKNNELLAVGIIKEVGDEYIKIGEKNGALHLIRCGTEVKINIISNKMGFTALSGTVLTSTHSEMKVVMLSQLVNSDRRNFFRVDLNIDAVVIFSRHANYPLSERIPVVIKDMSLCGLKIEINRELSDDAVIWTEMFIKNKTVCYQCKIIRQINRDGDRIQYGCEFIFNKFDDKDIIWSYLFQKQREQLNKSRNKNDAELG